MVKIHSTDHQRIAQRADLERQIAKGGTPDQVADWTNALRQVKREQATRITRLVKTLQALVRLAQPPELAGWQERRDALKKLILDPTSGGFPRNSTRRLQWRRQLVTVEMKIDSLSPAAKTLETATAKLARLVSLPPTDPDGGPLVPYLSAVRSRTTNMKQLKKEAKAHLPTALSFAKGVLRSQGYMISTDDVDEYGASAEERYINDPPLNRTSHITTPTEQDPEAPQGAHRNNAGAIAPTVEYEAIDDVDMEPMSPVTADQLVPLNPFGGLLTNHAHTRSSDLHCNHDVMHNGTAHDMNMDQVGSEEDYQLVSHEQNAEIEVDDEVGRMEGGITGGKRKREDVWESASAKRARTEPLD